MKNRISKMGKTLLGAMCLLSTCGLTYSCSDDYDLDETMPGFLGGSIYDELKARNFNTVVRLIDDLGYADVLSRTGSNTLFVADDEAYNKFFANTTWTDGNGNRIESYDQLSRSQKRMLLFSSMLSNADVLEMLSYSSGGGDLTMRRNTVASAVDSVPYWRWDQLPENLNVAVTDEDGETTADGRYWDKYRLQSRGGIYMALDATSPMMLHFTENQMKEKQITRDDVSFIFNNKNPWTADGTRRTYIYDAMVKEQDVTCLNGYFNVLDTVLVTPPNMAEVIRSNPETSYFSALLDRFSAPYYSATLTAQYKALYDIGNDSVFEKRYMSNRSNGGALTVDPDERSLGDFPFLTFDPGWNEYAASTSTPKEQDMAAMFVPTNQAMIDYFVNGGGRVLIERYSDRANTEDNLLYNLYQIPLAVVQPLINNLMKDSFLESVPSKYLTIMNDAQDQMFPASDYPSVDAYKSAIKTTLLANNGVVYVMDRLVTPADYASVMAPVIYAQDAKVVRAVIRADDNYVEGSQYANAPLKKYYSTYLKAMQSRFSFFVPTDDALGTYGLVDPISLATGTTAYAKSTYYRYLKFFYRNSSAAILPVRSVAFKYNEETGQTENDANWSYTSAIFGDGNTGTSEVNQAVDNNNVATPRKALLIDMVDQHIVVHDHDDDINDGMKSSRKYYTSRAGAPVYVADRGNTANGLGMIVDGGFQIQLKNDAYDNDHDCQVIESYDMTSETNNGYGNGMTYFLDRPMQPTTKSVYAVMKDDADFLDFFNFCNDASFGEEELRAVGFNIDANGNELTGDNWSAEQRKYRIFGSTADGLHPAVDELLVRFFNNYRYTIYVPTKAALDEAMSNGLMSAEQIREFIDENLDEDEQLSEENKAKARAMITMLFNFIKYHFQDEVLYVDNVASDGDYQTSCLDNVDNIYLKLHATQRADGTLSVRDNAGHSQAVTAKNNVLARDANFNASPTSGSGRCIVSSSYVVLHQVDDVLNFKTLTGGRYDADWATQSSANAFVKKYKIR